MHPCRAKSRAEKKKINLKDYMKILMIKTNVSLIMDENKDLNKKREHQWNREPNILINE